MINDSDEDAQALIAFSKDLDVEINVIPYNSINATDEVPPESNVIESGFVRPSPIDIQKRFVSLLREAGIFTTVRNSLGRSIAAACGQLANTGFS